LRLAQPMAWLAFAAPRPRQRQEAKGCSSGTLQLDAAAGWRLLWILLELRFFPWVGWGRFCLPRFLGWRLCCCGWEGGLGERDGSLGAAVVTHVVRRSFAVSRSGSQQHLPLILSDVAARAGAGAGHGRCSGISAHCHHQRALVVPVGLLQPKQPSQATAWHIFHEPLSNRQTPFAAHRQPSPNLDHPGLPPDAHVLDLVP
jgi:hypothetical protein